MANKKGSAFGNTRSLDDVDIEAKIKAYIDSKFSDWKDFTPVLHWGGTAPASLSMIARWMQIYKTRFFTIYIESNDSNGTTDLSIDIPGDFVSTSPLKSVVKAIELYGVGAATRTDPQAYIYPGINRIGFWDFHAGTDGEIIEFVITGFFEVDREL